MRRGRGAGAFTPWILVPSPVHLRTARCADENPDRHLTHKRHRKKENPLPFSETITQKS